MPRSQEYHQYDLGLLAVAYWFLTWDFSFVLFAKSDLLTNLGLHLFYSRCHCHSAAMDIPNVGVIWIHCEMTDQVATLWIRPRCLQIDKVLVILVLNPFNPRIRI